MIESSIRFQKKQHIFRWIQSLQLIILPARSTPRPHSKTEGNYGLQRFPAIFNWNHFHLWKKEPKFPGKIVTYPGIICVERHVRTVKNVFGILGIRSVVEARNTMIEIKALTDLFLPFSASLQCRQHRQQKWATAKEPIRIKLLGTQFDITSS